MSCYHYCPETLSTTPSGLPFLWTPRRQGDTSRLILPLLGCSSFPRSSSYCPFPPLKASTGPRILRMFNFSALPCTSYSDWHLSIPEDTVGFGALSEMAVFIIWQMRERITEGKRSSAVYYHFGTIYLPVSLKTPSFAEVSASDSTMQWTQTSLQVCSSLCHGKHLQ